MDQSRLIRWMLSQQQPVRRGQEPESEPNWPVDPQQPGDPGSVLTGQRRVAADAPPLSDPNWENWYNQLPPDQKLKYRPIYLQWLANQ